MQAPQAGDVAYAETFENDSLGASAAGWTTVSGTFAVCRPPGSTHVYCEKGTGDAVAVPTIFGSASWRDYTVDADLVHGSSGGIVALRARIRDAAHFYEFAIRSRSGSTSQSWELWKSNGGWSELLGRNVEAAASQTVHVRLVFAGSLITAYAGPASALVRIGSISDTASATGGIGIRTAESTTSTFDNLIVTVAKSGSPASPAPSSAPSTAPAPSGGVATFDGCPVFTPGDYYNADVTGAAVDAHSAQYLASIEAVDNTGFQDSLGIEPVNVAVNSTPLLTVHPQVPYHQFPVKYPWQDGFTIEDISDAHYVAVNTQSCHLYEAYGMRYANGELSGYSGKNYDLHQPFKVGGGVMASGLSYFAGAVRHEEIASGIHHALNLAVWQNALCNCYMSPAAATDGVSYNGPSSTFEMPYGAHLRLKASYDCSSFGPQSGAICTALKHYGLLLADTDGQYTNNNKLFFVNPTDGGSWDGGDLGALGQLRFADFDVLKVGAVSN